MLANGPAVCNAACACARIARASVCECMYVQPAALTCVGTGGREGKGQGGRNAMWNTLALDGSLSLSRPRGKFGSCFKPG